MKTQYVLSKNEIMNFLKKLIDSISNRSYFKDDEEKWNYVESINKDIIDYFIMTLESTRADNYYLKFENKDRIRRYIATILYYYMINSLEVLSNNHYVYGLDINNRVIEGTLKIKHCDGNDIYMIVNDFGIAKMVATNSAMISTNKDRMKYISSLITSIENINFDF